MKASTALWTTVTVVTAFTASLALAHLAAPAEETVTPVQRHALSDIPGKQVIVATVDYLPGQASSAHRHAGSVFAYVLEGEIVSELEGEPAIVYKAGESWYEPPLKPHLVSRNASTKRTAKLLAVLVMDEGGEAREPLPTGR